MSLLEDRITALEVRVNILLTPNFVKTKKCLHDIHPCPGRAGDREAAVPRAGHAVVEHADHDE